MLHRNWVAHRFVSKMKKMDQGQSLAPRAGVDFQLEHPDQVIPGAHPLPLRGAVMSSLRWPLISPYAPSPQRVHPYFTEPLPELPHFKCSVTPVYTHNTIRVPLIVPVFTLDNEISHTTELDPYLFGRYPNTEHLHWAWNYWDQRCQNFKIQSDHGCRELYLSNKKPYPNTGTGLIRAGPRKGAKYGWGALSNPMKPWTRRMPPQNPHKWRIANAMALTTKLLQGKLQVVERLALPRATPRGFSALCGRMRWDTRHTGAGVLFIDGGSRVAPSKEFNRSFFYGSFAQGRVKTVRPIVECQEPVDWNRQRQRLKYLGPKGPKNPVPLNRFNVYDCLQHDRLVLTEGAVLQMQQEVLLAKYTELPPHIRNQLPARGLMTAAPVTVEDEVAARVEEAEKPMYEGYYDNPYEPWKDENEAWYEVDEINARITRHTPQGEGSWRLLE